MDDKEFLQWIADRFVHVYGENENVDFLIKLRAISDHLAATEALTKRIEELEAERRWNKGAPEGEQWCLVHCEFGIQVDLWVPRHGWEKYGETVDAWAELPKAPQ